MFKKVKEFYREESKITLFVYIFLRFLVIGCMFLEGFKGNWGNVALGFLTLIYILFLIL